MKLVTDKQETRLITPSIRFTKQSQDPLSDTSQYFQDLLLEDHNAKGGSFPQFIEYCNREVIKSKKEATQ